MPRMLLGGVGFVVCVVVCGSGSASAQGLPTCAQLNTDPSYGLAGNPIVVQRSTTLVPASGGNPAYCRVDFTVSERGGPEFGYALGETQRIGLRVGLPANTSDGGIGGGGDGEGAWNGRVRNLGGGGLLGSVGAVTASTNARYVGSSSDGGQTAGEPSFGVIEGTQQLNLGKIEDFSSESQRLQYQWALRLARSYYGKPAIRNYWDGCSTGGRQGLVLAARYGDDFDGFLVGAPLTNYSRFSAANSWRAWVNKDVAGGTVTPGKLAAAINRMIGACDVQDGVVDGILSDPRTCRATATMNVCGQPGAPTDATCLTDAEARAIDMVVDGPRNDLGHKVWAPFDRASMANIVIGANGAGTNGIYGWAAKDMTFDWRTRPLSDWDDLHELATNTVGPHLDVESNLDLTRNRGGRILMWHGASDQTIPWQQSVYYYNTVVDRNLAVENVMPWFRFFMAPGVTHCGGGVGPQPQNLFNTLVVWVENGVAPDSILSSGGGRTRPLCPFPQTPIYDGAGNPNLASSFRCGGNIDTTQAKCEALLVKYQHETGAVYEDVGGVTDLTCGLAFAPETTAAVSPMPVNGWHRTPTVTLDATDRDSDLDHSEYRIDGGQTWTTYVGPFVVSGDGLHIVEYRSVDRSGHVEPPHSLEVRIDATPPVLAGLPEAACTIWPPNSRLVQIAAVTAVDGGSGVVPGSLTLRVDSNERLTPSDVVIDGGTVNVRASRSPKGTAGTYTVTAAALDLAGNRTTAMAVCVVPHDRSQ